MRCQVGYNKGDTYEEKIFDICNDKKVIFPGTKRAGAGGSADISLYCDKKKVNVEVKSEGADWGQKYLDFDKNGWYWQNPDSVTALYDDIGLINMIDPEFTPRNANIKGLPKSEWFELRKSIITKEDKQYDYKKFSKYIPCPLKILFEYYKKKDCFYIQLEDSGFYYLHQDKFDLGVPQFDGEVLVRFRHKTQHAHAYFIDNKKIKTKKEFEERKEEDIGNDFKIIDTPWDTVFSAVMKLEKKPTKSKFNLEENNDQEFPNII